ncbi:MAG: type I restriction enzyme HsdR N-terminal domain-containing protein [Thaumarchaeota archaeon]|nr:type I restriction enzyme HsdR N-terminal domain-containing protein [Nitrososphaerota archaeon]
MKIRPYYRIEPNKWLFTENADVLNAQRRASNHPEMDEKQIEEYVRQWVIKELITTYGYPQEWVGRRIVIEESVQIGSTEKRADISIKNEEHKNFLIIETKARDLPNTDYVRAEKQLQSYLAATIGALYGMLTDGNVMRTKVLVKKQDPNQFDYADDIPFHKPVDEVPKKILDSLHIGWLGDNPFHVDPQIIVTGRTCLIGASGSGKSYALGVICEELMKIHLPFMLIDVEGEYFGLKVNGEAIWVGDDSQCDLLWDSVDLEQLGRDAPNSAPLILDLSEADDPKRKLDLLLTSLYEEVSRRRTPYLIILEEADRFVPQIGDRLQIFDEIARRGRKRGLGLIVSTQRPSLVDKNLLSQCTTQIIGKLVIKNDLHSVAQFFSGKGLPNQLTSLGLGFFYVSGGLSQAPTCIKIKNRETPQGGMTPSLESRVMKSAKETISKVRISPEPQKRGLAPLFKPDEVLTLVRPQKKLFFFNRDEVVKDIQLIYRPLVELELRIRKGLVKKRFVRRFFILDGVSGRTVSLEDRLRFKQGIEHLLGLEHAHIELLTALSPNKGLSNTEISRKTKMSEEIVRKLIKVLEQKRLVFTLKVGRNKVARRIVDLPNIQLSDRMIQFEQNEMPEGKMGKITITERNVRFVLEGLFDRSTLERFSPFNFPLYRVVMTAKRKQRIIWIDARTGKTIDL